MSICLLARPSLILLLETKFSFLKQGSEKERKKYTLDGLSTMTVYSRKKLHVSILDSGCVAYISKAFKKEVIGLEEKVFDGCFVKDIRTKL